MEIDDSHADAGRSPHSVRVPFINDALMKLVVELNKATQAVKEATEQSKTSTAQIRENLALAGNSVQGNLADLGDSISRAAELAKENSKSSAKIARSLNILTFCLVLVG